MEMLGGRKLDYKKTDVNNVGGRGCHIFCVNGKFHRGTRSPK